MLEEGDQPINFKDELERPPPAAAAFSFDGQEATAVASDLDREVTGGWRSWPLSRRPLRDRLVVLVLASADRRVDVSAVGRSLEVRAKKSRQYPSRFSTLQEKALRVLHSTYSRNKDEITPMKIKYYRYIRKDHV